MDNKAIETLSINAVRNSIVRSDSLDQFIADNDKEPSWDGFVYIYDNKSKKKDRLKGRMPVQVKGIENNDFSKDEITFPVEIADLKNYLYDGGIVFFVVYVRSDGLLNKIYYAELPPIKLRSILDGAKEQKTKNITLKAFPDDGNEKATLFLGCWNHCQKQSSFVDAQLHTLEELEAQGVLEGITTSVTGYRLDRYDPQKAFFTNELYMYAKIKGSTIPQPLKFIPLDIHTVTESKALITVNGISFYDYCTRVRSKNSIAVKIGQSLNIALPSETVKDKISKISYKNSSNLRVLVKDLDFLLAALDAGQFEFDGHVFPLDFSKGDLSNFDIDQQRDMLAHHKKIVQVFDVLGATDDVELTRLTVQEKRHIDQLITAFIDKEPVSGLKPDLSPVLTLKIADFKFMLAFIHVKGQKDTYNIYDFFRKKYEIRYKDKDGNEGDMSQYAILKATDYLEITNIRFDELLPAYQCVKDNAQKYIQANTTLLNLLTAYDTCGGSKPILLKTARDFSEWLMEADEDDLPYDIRCLNRLQVIRRQREFTLDEIKELCTITENSSTREDVLVGAYLLLGNQMAAEVHYENLEPEIKEAFKDYPICYFRQAR